MPCKNKRRRRPAGTGAPSAERHDGRGDVRDDNDPIRSPSRFPKRQPDPLFRGGTHTPHRFHICRSRFLRPPGRTLGPSPCAGILSLRVEGICSHGVLFANDGVPCEQAALPWHCWRGPCPATARRA